ncbi:MAG: PA0069 family radical SAM protein [Alphaproteobacteria bacterium]|nr:PA0069 family radical SAM protein [Alphaproteobacteria bacterium]
MPPASDDAALPLVPPPLLKGRGTSSNPANRFEHQHSVTVDDGWGSALEDKPAPKTTVTPDTSRTVIARNDSPDIPFDQSLNPYRGCEHGCVYCFARPTHAWLGLSPGLEFETKLLAKRDAARLLEKALRRPGYRCQVLVLGSNTDPYQPIERQERITRSVLEVLAAFQHPVAIITKSALVTRDLDLLAPMAAAGLASVGVSITTLEPSLARTLEPRAASPQRRLDTIRQLAAAGVPSAVLASPMIPGLNDHELERILEAAAEAGATTASMLLLRLPLETKDLMEEWLATHAPLARDRVLSLIRQTRNGRLNDPEFGTRFRGTGPYADQLQHRFRLATKRLGLAKRPWTHDTTQFRPPPAPGDQLSLL